MGTVAIDDKDAAGPDEAGRPEDEEPAPGPAASSARSTTTASSSWASSSAPTDASPTARPRAGGDGRDPPRLLRRPHPRRPGAPEGRLTMSRLSTDVALTTGGVTRLVDRMAEAGLVSRQNCPNDRRSIHVVLTPAGQAVLGAGGGGAHRRHRPAPHGTPVGRRPRRAAFGPVEASRRRLLTGVVGSPTRLLSTPPDRSPAMGPTSSTTGPTRCPAAPSAPSSPTCPLTSCGPRSRRRRSSRRRGGALRPLRRRAQPSRGVARRRGGLGRVVDLAETGGVRPDGTGAGSGGRAALRPAAAGRGTVLG